MQSDVMTFWNFTNIIHTSSSLYNFCLFKTLWITYCAFLLPLYLLIFNRSKNIHSHLHSLPFYYHSYVQIYYFNITHFHSFPFQYYSHFYNLWFYIILILSKSCLSCTYSNEILNAFPPPFVLSFSNWNTVFYINDKYFFNSFLS